MLDHKKFESINALNGAKSKTENKSKDVKVQWDVTLKVRKRSFNSLEEPIPTERLS